IVQEGLTNINKHAQAARARVDLDFRAQAGDLTASERRWLTLTIENDRCGAADGGMIAQGNGFGLIGMRERVMALGGQLDIIDLGDRGFKLHAMIPFEIPARLAQGAARQSASLLSTTTPSFAKATVRSLQSTKG